MSEELCTEIHCARSSRRRPSVAHRRRVHPAAQAAIRPRVAARACARGMRQSMPSSSIDSCAGVSDTLPDVGLRPDEAAALESLGQQHQALAVEPQHLEDVAAAAAEDEDVAAERVLGERGLHQRGQAVEALPHVGVAGGEPHARARGQADHAALPSACSTQRTVASSTAPRSAHAGSADVDLDDAARRATGSSSRLARGRNVPFSPPSPAATSAPATSSLALSPPRRR